MSQSSGEDRLRDASPQASSLQKPHSLQKPQQERARVRARALAPAKINLGLFVGPIRESDGRHELASVMQSISLADELTLESIESAADGASHPGVAGVVREPGEAPTGAAGDKLVCPGVPGDPAENLAAAALRAFREATGWDAGPLRLSIDKRIPVAAGLGGGSADAAAALRLARHASGFGSDELLLELAAQLGADVPAQIAPGRWLATGAGERLRELPAPSHPFGVLVLPVAAELSTAAVYARADELGTQRTTQAISDAARSLEHAFELGAGVPDEHELLHNDLQAAAISLCPQIKPALTQAMDSGADVAFVSGSGPTVVGLFLRANGPGRAQRAVAGLSGRDPAPICATPVDAAYALVGSVPDWA
jgi:4-diphosphocytidyl-2-C-methyl-D-erythritol kinase